MDKIAPKSGKKEKRRFRRARAHDRAVLLWNGEHEECHLRDISGSGAQLVMIARPPVDSEVVLYSDNFGRFRGQVVRHGGAGIALSFRITDGQVEKVLSLLQERLAATSLKTELEHLPREQRVLLETLVITGKIAASRAPDARHFWQVIDACRGQGLVSVKAISGDLFGIELTPFGRGELSF